MVRIETGQPDRVVQSTDYEAEDLLSWDWTTLASTCESATSATDMAELLTVRPYDGLPLAADPLARACELPNRAESVDPEGWPVFGIPKIEKRKVKFARPPFQAPALPKGEEWKATKTVRRYVGPPPAPEALSVSLFRSINSSVFGINRTWTSPTTIQWGAATADSISVGGTFSISGGDPGSTYNVSIGISNSTTNPTTLSTPFHTGTYGPGNAQAWSAQPWLISLPMFVGIGDTLPFALYYSKVGGGASGWVLGNIYVPGDLPGS
ncbi:hypothetical protein EBZ39_03195 [bacterium]|nr:hypothetical protein [bacterium]